MVIPKPIDVYEARRRADLSGAGFETTADLEVLTTSIGQPRAVEALKLGVGIDTDGYNIFVLGPPASGRHALAESFLEPVAATRPTPPDWCYVHNFEDARKPRLLELAAGTGERLRRELEKLAEELRTVLATALESDEYQTRRQIVDEEYKTLTEKLFGEVEEEARKRGLALLRTPMGVAVAPLKENGEIAPPEEFQKLPEEERKRIQESVEELQEQLRKSLDQAPRWERERQERLRQLNNEVVEAAIRPPIDELKSHYQEHANVLAYLDAVRQDVIEKHADILQAPPPTPAGPQRIADLALRRYHVNVLVDNSGTRGAPVIYENNPTYANLVGRVEHVAREGVLTTDFTLIKAGALQRANGGYLILDARRILQQPFAYDALKRALQSGEVRIESPAEALSLITTITLEPEPVPLDVKVVIIGEPQLYYLLTQYDPDFEKLFKIPADLDAEIDRDGAEPLYARLVATLVKERALRPFDRSAVERVIEESARMAGDASKLSSKVEDIGDLVRESDYWAGQAEAPVVDREHVERAVEARIFRLDRLRERMQEMTLRDLIYIDTDGARVGQVNGLSVISLGNFMFGRPT
ncbi:MAG TPA: ATP-binding protein, partial [Thermoanaerobaculia bacterium]|nr:ATP-binding protein [Thermoanaerobaculia bacterium]